MTEVLIAGAGPAGMAAAVTAAAGGAKVTLLDDNPGPGGQIWRGGDPRNKWFDRLRRTGSRVITSSRIVSGDPCRRTLLVETQDRAFNISYRKLILATGARELFLPFPGWTSPRVAGVGGLQALVKSGLSVAGKRIVVAGSGPFLLAAAAYLHKSGAEVPLIAEQASGKKLLQFARRLFFEPGKLAQAAALRLRLRKTRYLTSCWVVEMSGDTATLRQGDRMWRERCDYLATGYGFQPNVELAAALGCALEHGCIEVNRLQQTTTQDIYAAGECTGIGGVELALIEGEIAGLDASGQAPQANLQGRRNKALKFAAALKETFELRQELQLLPREDTIVCRCEDVRWGALKNSRSRREGKLYTRCGMGPCQGRICGPMLDFLAFPDRDTVRPPIFPARLETLSINEETTPR